jgi:hypothetical protein
MLQTEGADVTGLLSGAATATLRLSDGDRLQFLRYTEPSLPAATTYTLRVTTAKPGNLLAKVNSGWRFLASATDFSVEVTELCHPGESNLIELFFTAAEFPFDQEVTSVRLEGR